MNVEEYRDYCLSFPSVSESFPFNEIVLVFKVLDKMFCFTDINAFEMINLKCNPEKAIELRETYPCVRPGYHMNKKHWNSVYLDGSISDKLIQEWIQDSYNLVAAKMPKKKQTEIYSNRKDY